MNTPMLSNIQEELIPKEFVQEELIQEEIENMKREVRIGPDRSKSDIMNYFKVQLKEPKFS